MAVALVSHTAVGLGLNGGTTATGFSTSGANCIIVAVAADTVASWSALTDSRTLSWTPLTAREPATTADIRLYYAYNITGGTDHTFTITGTGLGFAIAIAAFSGVKSSADPFTTENGNTTASASSLGCGSITPGANDDLIVSALTNHIDTTADRTCDNSLALLDQVVFAAGSNYPIALAWKNSSSGAFTPTWSWTFGAEPAGAVVACFSAAAGGASPSRLATLLPMTGVQ